MQRLAFVVLLSSCSFQSKVPAQGEPDADTSMPPDAPPGDTTPVMTPTVRQISVAPGKVNGTHADFPVLFTATITSAHPMGFDISFTADRAGTMRLAHEIERYQANELVAWVKIPSLSQATQIYLHYGDTTITTSQENAAAVWNPGYAAVWHLSALGDSTTRNNATASGGMTATGQIASARAFDGSASNLNAGSDNSIDNLMGGGGGTMEAWFHATSYGESGRGRIFDKGGVLLAMCQGNIGGSNAVMFSRTATMRDGIWCSAQGTIALDAWTHVAVTYTDGGAANKPTFFINGAQVGLGIDDAPMGSLVSDGGTNMLLGDAPAGGRAFAGRIDEARLSAVRRSAEWIGASYENQRDPAAFFMLSPPL